jgi:uncharacterized protein
VRTNIRFLRHALALGLVAVIAAACSGPKSPETAYYSLLGAQTVGTTAGQNNTLVLSLGPVTVPDMLRQSQIATGGESGRYHLSEYHRWTGDLDRDITRAVAELLASRLGTEQVLLYPVDRRLNPTVQVALDILAMDGELGREARLVARWTLIDPQGKRPARVGRGSYTRQPSGPGHDAWVEAQQRNLGALSDEIATLIRTGLPAAAGR